MPVLMPVRNKLVLSLQTIAEHAVEAGTAWFSEASLDALDSNAKALLLSDKSEALSEDDQALLWEIVCDLWVRRGMRLRINCAFESALSQHASASANHWS